jgi:uncharacterized protein (TIGR00251 family)
VGTIAIRLKPGAKQDRITIGPNAEIAVAVTAPPVEGKANSHLIKFIAKKIGVPKSACSIIKGHTARNKVVKIDDVENSEIRTRLMNAQ